MSRLRARDLRALGECVAAVGECRDLGELRTGVLPAVRQLVECDSASYNEIGRRPDEVIAFADPVEVAHVEGVMEGFARFAHQNPLVAHQERTGDGRPHCISDFLTHAELHRLDLYRHVYRPLETEYQIAVGLAASESVIAIAANRLHADFDELERARLDALRPFLVAAHDMARLRARAKALVAASRQASADATTVVLIDLIGRVEPSDERSTDLLASLRAQGCAERLEGWARVRRRARPCDAQQRPQLLLPTSGHGVLVAHYVAGAQDEYDAILLELPPPEQSPEALRPLGLTRRQCEVLYLIWRHHSTAEIADTLGVSVRTVDHHLEAIYRRLGVQSRMDAAKHADALLRGDTFIQPG